MNKFLTESMEKIFNTLGSNLDEFKDKTILITGANGLIGGFLSDFFIIDVKACYFSFMLFFF